MTLSLTCDDDAPAPRPVTVTLRCDGCGVRTMQAVDDPLLKTFMPAGWKVAEGKHYGPCCSGKKSAERGSGSRR